jgi:hypothetical protein
MSDFKEWVQKRGFLYFLTQTPLLAILFGYFFKLLPFSVMILSVILAFCVLPAWIVHRKTVSQDPDEPVHYLAKFALWAIPTFPIFSLVRIPTHYAWQMIYWHPWYEFAARLTGIPSNQFSSLALGGFLNAIQGFALTMGFYILFKKRSLLNAMLYIVVFDCSIYSFIFPPYSRIGMQSSPKWHAVAWGAHVFMAAAVWYSPIFFEKVLPSLTRVRKVAALAVVIVAVSTPYIFPFYRAVVWQFPTQHKADQELFNRPNLVTLARDPQLVQRDGSEARYSFALRIGPRRYSNYHRRQKMLEFEEVLVNGKIKADGQTVAWCNAFTPTLPNPDEHSRQEVYMAKLSELDLVDLEVSCEGPVTAVPENGAQLSAEWEMHARLLGDRETVEQSFASAPEVAAAAFASNVSAGGK